MNCVACNRPDEAENMVSCDKCGEWQHYGCAGVDDEIKHNPWMCEKCSSGVKTTVDSMEITNHAEQVGGNVKGELKSRSATRSAKERSYDDDKRSLKEEQSVSNSAVASSTGATKKRYKDEKLLSTSGVEEQPTVIDGRSIERNAAVRRRDDDTLSKNSGVAER